MLLNAGRCECLWHDPGLFLFAKEGFGKLSEDNSSSVRVSASTRTMGFFPLSRTVGCFLTRSIALLLRQDCVFSLPSPKTIVFTLQVLIAILQFPHLPCLFLLLLLHILTLMKELVFGRLNHWIARHCNCVRRIRCGEGNHRSYWWRRVIRNMLEPSFCTSSMRLFVRFPQTVPIVVTWII